jgi:hypothetical protein
MSTSSQRPGAKAPPDERKLKGALKKVSKEHLILVLQETALKLTRSLTPEEMGAVTDAVAKLDHPITTDEAVAIVEAMAEPQQQAEFEVSKQLLLTTLEKELGRPLTNDEEEQSIESLEESEAIETENDFHAYVEQIVAYIREAEARNQVEEQARARAAEEAAHPLETWTKDATELGTHVGSAVEKLVAMQPQIEQVNKNFAKLKARITDGSLPETARIMPDVEWKKKMADGSLRDEKGFLHFEDYCCVVLKRSKQAVYAMLKNCAAPAEPKAKETDPEKIKGSLLKRGTTSLSKLFEEWLPLEPTLTLAAMLQRLQNSIAANNADELKKARNAADEAAKKRAALEALAGGVPNNHATPSDKKS